MSVRFIKLHFCSLKCYLYSRYLWSTVPLKQRSSRRLIDIFVVIVLTIIILFLLLYILLYLRNIPNFFLFTDFFHVNYKIIQPKQK